MTIALTGAHRCGKTTLAKAYAEKHGVKFVATTASAVFARMGLDPAKTYDFSTRLLVQGEILKEFDAIWGEHSLEPTITDRCPIDLLGYTMAEAIGESVKKKDQARFEQYVHDCFAVLNKRFSIVVLVQPGIPIVKAKGKAALNQAYIEHISSLMFGLMMDERTKVAHYYIRRGMTDLEERVAALENAVGKTEYAFQRETLAYCANGGVFH